MGDAAHAMVPFYGQGMNAVSLQFDSYCRDMGIVSEHLTMIVAFVASIVVRT